MNIFSFSVFCKVSETFQISRQAQKGTRLILSVVPFFFFNASSITCFILLTVEPPPTLSAPRQKNNYEWQSSRRKLSLPEGFAGDRKKEEKIIFPFVWISLPCADSLSQSACRRGLSDDLDNVR